MEKNDNKNTDIQQEPQENTSSKDNWRGRFNPLARDPKNDTPMTIAGILFIVLAVIAVIMSQTN